MFVNIVIRHSDLPLPTTIPLPATLFATTDATLSQMDLVGSIRFYVDRMFENVRGMKSLILDRETVNTPGREGGGLEG